MKKITIQTYIIFMLLTMVVTNLAAQSSTKSRRVYCVAMHNPDLGYKYGVTVFNTGTPSEMQLLHPFGNGYSIYAGAAANDIYYAYFYEYVQGPVPVSFSSVNLRTGEEKEIVNWRDKNPGDWPKCQDMTYDYVTGKLYSVAFSYGQFYLETIDLETGERKKVVNIEGSAATIAASNDGTLYVIDKKGNLCTLNKEDGTLTTIMATEWEPSINQTMEFDRTDGVLYWATGEIGVEESYLVKFDLEKKTYENLGVLGGAGTQVVGMYIPFLAAGDGAPGAATDVRAVPDPNGLKKAVITWKNPVKTFGEDNLLEITGMTLSRNGEVLKTYDRVEDLVMGKEMSFEDTPEKEGEFVYSICAVNSAGTGAEGKVDCYVGYDNPVPVENLQGKINPVCKSVTLTWEAPVKGAHNGYFDPSTVTYTITRLPDQEVLAEGYKGLTYMDENTGRLTGFTYQVTAVNEAGSSKLAKTEKLVTGSPLSIPYSYDFIDEDVFSNNWMVYNNSKSGNTFVIRSPYGKIYFNDPQLLPAAEYMMQGSGELVDEWLITPPLVFEKGKQNVLTFGARNRGTDQLVVTLGNNNTIEAQGIEMETFIVQSDLPEVDDKTQIPFTIYTVDFGQITGTYCIGFHLNTPPGNSVIFQIGNVYVGEPQTSISGQQLSNVNVFNLENTLQITGEYNKAEIFNAAGIHMGNVNENQSQVSTTGWASGIYFVKVTSGNAVKIFKTILK